MKVIRKAVLSDLPAIVDIYNQAINSRRCAGHTVCFSVEERLPWFKEHDDMRTPIYVFESEGDIIAYCSITYYRPGRQAVDGVGEISYFVDFRHHKKGIGNLLMRHLLEEAKKLGYTYLVAILLDCNTGSIALLEKFGFDKVGEIPKIARIDGNCYSHLYYGVSLI